MIALSFEDSPVALVYPALKINFVSLIKAYSKRINKRGSSMFGIFHGNREVRQNADVIFITRNQDVVLIALQTNIT